MFQLLPNYDGKMKQKITELITDNTGVSTEQATIITNKILKLTYSIENMEKAFKDGRLYEAGELELNTAGRETAFECWLEQVFENIPSKEQWELENPPKYKFGEKVIVNDSSSCFQSELNANYLSDKTEWVDKYTYFNASQGKEITVNGHYQRLCEVLITDGVPEVRIVYEEMIRSK